MSQRLVAIIVQPCILCESPMEEWHVYLDAEVSIEEIIVEPLEHNCAEMKSLLRERIRSVYRR